MKRKIVDRLLDGDAFKAGSILATGCSCIVVLLIALFVTGCVAIVLLLWRVALGGM